MKTKRPWHHKEVLEAMYVLQGLNLKEIASIFGITVPGVAYWMDKFKIKRRDGDIGDRVRGTKLSEERKEKLSERAKDQFRDKTRHPMYGRKHTEESKQKMSETKRKRRQERLGKKI